MVIRKVFDGRARTLGPVVVFSLLGVEAADAKARCCGGLDATMLQGADLGVWFLLGVTLLVQLGFGLFFLILRQRLSLVRDPLPRPVLRLIKGGAWSDATSAIVMPAGTTIAPGHHDENPTVIALHRADCDPACRNGETSLGRARAVRDLQLDAAAIAASMTDDRDTRRLS